MDGGAKQQNQNGYRKYDDGIEPAVSPSWVFVAMIVNCRLVQTFTAIRTLLLNIK